MQFQIKHGLRRNIDKIADANKIEGCWYICTDTFEVFVCLNGNLEPIKAASSFDDDIVDLKARVDALEAASEAEVKVNTVFDLPEQGLSNIVYIVVKDNAAYRWNENTGNYVCIGRDWMEINRINGGDASSVF